MLGRDEYTAAFRSKSSVALQPVHISRVNDYLSNRQRDTNSLAHIQSWIHTVGLRPIQKVITGLFNEFESCSKYIQGLFFGRRWVLPTIGNGRGPGG